MSNRIRELLDQRYDRARPRLRGTVTSAPMTGGRSAGYVVATVGGVAGVRVTVSPDLRAPLVAGDEIEVEAVGTPAATTYTVANRLSGQRPDSDVYVFPGGDGATYEAGDILLGSTLANWSNWWYQFQYGRWIIRKGTTMQGAIGNLSGLYGYTDTTYGAAWGEYGAGKVWIGTDPSYGFRVMSYDTRVFQADTVGNASFGRAGAAEIVIAPGEQQIKFVVNGVTQSAIDAESRTIYGFERLGRPLGPCIEWGAIPDPSGQESLERWGFWLRNQEGDRFFAVLSGTEANPTDASFRVGSQGSAHYLEYVDRKLNIAGTMNVLGGVITGNLDIVNGRLTWANGKGVADDTGLSYTENATNYLRLKTDLSGFLQVYADSIVTNAAILGVCPDSPAVYGITETSYGVRADATKAGGVAIGAFAAAGAYAALTITGGIVAGGNQRYTDLADATADTDALNRQTGDGRYMLSADEADYLLADGSRTGATGQAQTFTNGIIVNEGSNDSDTRIEGNGEANLFFVDAGNDRIGIGTAIPGSRFSLVETATDAATADHCLVDDVYTVAVTTDSYGSYSALNFKTVVNSTADKYIANAIGSQGLVVLYSGTPDNIAGFNGEIDVFGGTTYNASGLTAKLVTFGGTTATWSGVKVLSPENYGGTLTTVIGLNVENITGATNNYAIRTNTGLIVFNEGGNADSDVRIEGDTDANLLFTDAGNDRVGIGTNAPAVKLDVRGGLALPTKTIAVADSPYTVLSTDYTIRCNCVGGAITVALPEATGSGRILNIKKTDSSANAVTVDGYSTNTIDGAATVDIGTQYANMQIQDVAAGVWDIL